MGRFDRWHTGHSPGMSTQMRELRFLRWASWIVIAAVACLAVAVSWISGSMPYKSSYAPSIIASIGAPFRLTSHTGESVDNASLAGKPYLVFFGFTQCPDVCPTTLFALSELMKQIGADANRFRVLFITVDPERDTQDLLAQYLTAFDERIVALRGTVAETEVALNAFAAYARKRQMENGQYTMDHTAGVYLMNAQGRFSGMLDVHEPRAAQLQKLRRLVADAG
jgi:protein SCO1/2